MAARTLVLDALDHLPAWGSALLFGAGADVALNIALFVPVGAVLALLGAVVVIVVRLLARR